MGWKTVTVRSGDTLQRLALRELGTAMRWAEIAALNNLLPPYFAQEATDNVIAYGGNVLLPIPQADSLATADDPFLTDLLLTEEGFLSVTEGGDLATVSGVENLEQALEMRVVAHKRSMLFHPEYGSWVFTLVGRVNIESQADLTAFYAQSAMIEDPRIKSIADISAVIIDDGVAVTAKVNPVYGEAISFEGIF